MGLKDKYGSLKRELGLLDVFCIASGAMISSGLFILPGIAFADAGPSIIFAYIIASLLVIPAMLTSCGRLELSIKSAPPSLSAKPCIDSLIIGWSSSPLS